MEIATESESVSHDEGISMPYEDRSNIRQVSVKATDQIGQSPIICIRGVRQGGGPSGAGALLFFGIDENKWVSAWDTAIFDLSSDDIKRFLPRFVWWKI